MRENANAHQANCDAGATGQADRRESPTHYFDFKVALTPHLPLIL